MIDVNIKGVANVLRHFVPAMIERGRGVIVNFSSGWGAPSSAEVAPYCATKWAIEGLTRALAEELPGMAAVPLNPGIIDTDMLRTALARRPRRIPTRRRGRNGRAVHLEDRAEGQWPAVDRARVRRKDEVRRTKDDNRGSTTFLHDSPADSLHDVPLVVNDPILIADVSRNPRYATLIDLEDP